MSDFIAQWALVPMNRLDAFDGSRRALVTLDWPAPLRADPWLGLLLPSRDYNRALAGMLTEVRLPAGSLVGAFLAHPFLDLDALLHGVEAAGAAGIAAFPGISRLTSGFAGTAEQGGLSLATESQRLLAAAERGFEVMASVGAPGIGPPPPGLVADWVVTVPRVPAAELPPVRRAVLDYRPGAGSASAMPLSLRRAPAAPG